MKPPVDPIQYAWELCNEGTALPEVLARSGFRDPNTGKLTGKAYAARAVVHSGIIRRRAARPNGVPQG
jgi:hypothetical protein